VQVRTPPPGRGRKPDALERVDTPTRKEAMQARNDISTLQLGMQLGRKVKYTTVGQQEHLGDEQAAAKECGASM
jgi:hypothetical protein